VPLIPAIPFGIALPASITHTNNDDNDMPSLIGEKGIVGSIIIMGKKSAMIWVGWGTLDLPSSLVVSPSGSLTTTTMRKAAATTSSNSKIKKSISFGKGEYL